MPAAVTVGGLVINLAAETSQLKTDMAEGARAVDAGAKSMINSMAGISESSDRATDAGARMVRQLKEEIATFGMSSQELQQYKANLNGVGGEVESLMGRLNQMKASQAGFTDQLAASEAQATQRIREMVAASMSEVTALNDVATATQAATSAQAAATTTGRTLTETQRLQILNMQGVAASMKAVQEGTVAMSSDTQRILAQYDPLGAKLRALQADLATLRKEMGNSVDPAAIKAFQGLENEIAKTQGLMAQAATQANAFGSSTSQLTLTQTQLIERFKQQADTIGMSRSQLMAYQATQAGVTAQTKDAIAAVKAHEDAIKAAAKAKEDERNQTSMLSDAYKFLAAGYAALKIGEYIKDASMMAARYETLGVVMGVVGKTAGYTKTQMDAASEGVAKQGITMTESRDSVIKLVQAHIDLSNASALARIAQDAAVIGNINSSEAFERLVNGVARGNVLILRNIGINVNLQAAYAQMADSLGKSTRELTENERVQARLNAVLERGTDIAGTYEAAMDTASKQISSMKRYTEDLKTTFGEVFNEALTIGVMALTDGLKDANGEVSELAKNGQLAEWGHDLTTVFVGIANTVNNAYTTFQKFDAFARHLDARKAINADADAQSKAVSDYGNGMAEKGAVDRVRRIESVRQSALAQENADYVTHQAELSGNFDRFQRAADERMASRLAKQKASADERLKVDQDYAARAQALNIANAGKSIEFQRAAQAKLAKDVYVGTPNFRDTEERASKPKVDQADNTLLQDQLARIEKASAAEKQETEYLMKLDDMRHKAGELSDSEYYESRRNYLVWIAEIEDQTYNKELTELRAHHNATQAEEAKNQKAIHDILDKQAAARKKVQYDQLLDEEEARLREKKLYDDTVKATLGAGATTIKGLDGEIEKQREHNAEIGKTKEQIELAKQAQVDLATTQLQSDADYVRDGLTKWALDDKSRALYEMRLTDLDGEIARRRTLAGLFADGADAEANAKAAADLDKYLDPTKATAFGNALQGSFGGATNSLSKLTKALQTYSTQQAAAEKERQNAERLSKGNAQERAQAVIDLDAINRRSTQEQLGSYGDMASAASGFFDKSSNGYKALQTASEVMHAAQLAMNLASIAPAMAAGAAQFFAQSGWGGFAGVAAMAAVVAGFGVAVSGGSSSTSAADRQAAQGTGTVLGDGSAKSDSIAKGIQLTAANSSTQINYLSGLLTTLKGIETDIKSFAAELVQSTDISNPDANLNSNNGLGKTAATAALVGAGFAAGSMVTLVGSVLGPVGAVGALIASKIPVLNNVLGKIGTALFGGKQSVTDSGFTLDKTSVGSALTNGVNGQSYTEVHTSGGLFSSGHDDTKETSLGADANQQFSAIIKSLASSITQASGLLGMSGDAFTKQLNSFVIDIGDVSLKGLSGADQEKAIEAVFSKLGDQMAQAAIPDLAKFQQVGEGYLETLVRVASDYAKVDASLQSVGLTFGSVGVASIAARENLIALAGGIDTFQSETADFATNFLTKAQQLAPVKAYVDQAMAALGYSGVTTREQFASIVQGLDLSSAAGEQTYATLMGLESAFAAITPAIVDVTKSAQDIVDERKDLQDQLDTATMTSAQLLKKQRDAIDASNRALFDQVQIATQHKDLQDQLNALTQTAAEKLTAQRDALDGSNRALFDQVQAMTDASSALDLQGQIYAATGDKAGAAAVLLKQHQIAILQVNPALEELTQQLWDVQAAATAAADAKTTAGTLVTDAETALTTLQNITKVTTDALTKRITAEQALSDAVKSTLSSMTTATDSLDDRAAAQAQIKAAVASVKAGGALPDADSLKDAFSVVSKDSAAQFATQADYLKDLYSTKNDLGDLADSSLSVDQKQLDSLNDMLTNAQKQLDVLKGIDTTGLTIAQALAGFQSSIAVAGANPINAATSAIGAAYQSSLGRAPDAAGLAYWQQAAAGGSSLADIKTSIGNSSEALIQKAYQDLLGRPADGAGLAFYMGTGESIAQIKADLMKSDEGKAHQKAIGVPGFAAGGDFGGGLRLVGENGPELEVTGPSRIFNANQTSSLMNRLSNPSNNNDALVAAVKALQQEVVALRQANSAENVAIAKSSAKTADALEGAATGGRPLITQDHKDTTV